MSNLFENDLNEMEKDDSGIDSDNKPCSNDSFSSNQMPPDNSPTINIEPSSLKKKPVISTSELQKKIEKQRDKNRRKDLIDEQPKKSFLLPRNRLNIPAKSSSASVLRSEQELPLVLLSDDSEEDEFAVGAPMSREAQREITQQLIKDGYNLDLEPDDEDLDLIPPRPLHERLGLLPWRYLDKAAMCTHVIWSQFFLFFISYSILKCVLR